jgi:hypothetical protein
MGPGIPILPGISTTQVAVVCVAVVCNPFCNVLDTLTLPGGTETKPRKDGSEKCLAPPLRRACTKLGPIGRPLPKPKQLPVADASVVTACKGRPLEELGLARMPVRSDGSVVDWGALVLRAWQCSEEVALSTLRSFLLEGAQPAPPRVL